MPRIFKLARNVALLNIFFKNAQSEHGFLLFQRENFNIDDYLEEFTTAVPEDVTRQEQTTFYNNLATTFETTTAEKVNFCSCNNGTQAEFDDCFEDGEERCVTCDTGFYLLSPEYVCEMKKCECLNGSGSFGKSCSKHGVLECENCETGYHLSNNTCIENKCFCENGENASGKNCTENGSKSQNRGLES